MIVVVVVVVISNNNNNNSNNNNKWTFIYSHLQDKKLSYRRDSASATHV